MQFRRLFWLLPAGILTSLLQGCGGVGGSSKRELPDNTIVSTRPDGSFITYGEQKKIDQFLKEVGARHKELSKVHKGPGGNYLKVETMPRDKRQGMSVDDHMDMLSLGSKEGLSALERQTFESSKRRFMQAYKNSSVDNLPHASYLVMAKYIGSKGSEQQQKQYVRDLLSEKKAINIDQDFDALIAAMDSLSAELTANKAALPTIQHQSVLMRSGTQQWHLHVATIHQIQKSSNSEQRFNELKDDMPVMVDIHGNNALITGLQEDQWYVYGQGYAFRGHWEPAQSVRQDYTGKGMEFGLLKALHNGWALGGMFGFQAVRMNIGQVRAKADADVYRIGSFASWSNDQWSLDGMLTYGWVNMKTSQGQWNGSPEGSEWAAHIQGCLHSFSGSVGYGFEAGARSLSWLSGW